MKKLAHCLLLCAGLAAWPGVLPAADGAQASGAESAFYGPIKPGESLWAIAGKTRPGPSVDRFQMMLALLYANPEAFQFPCNLQSLRQGARLRLPGPEAIRALTPAQAAKEIQRQEQAWKTYRKTGGLDCAEPPALPATTQAAGPAPPPATTDTPALEADRGRAGADAPLPPDAPVAAPEPPRVPTPLVANVPPSLSAPVPARPEARAPPPGETPAAALSGAIFVPLLSAGVLLALLIGLGVAAFSRRAGPPPGLPAVSAPATDGVTLEPRRVAPVAPEKKSPPRFTYDSEVQALRAELDRLFSGTPPPRPPPPPRVAEHGFDERDFALLPENDKQPAPEDLDELLPGTPRGRRADF